MPPLPPVANTARVRLYGHIATHEWQLVDYFHWASGAPAAGDMHAMALAYGGILASSPFSTTDISHECVVDHCSAEDLTTTSGEFADVLTPGTGGASQATHANAAV